MKSDFISRSEAEKLGATCLARRNENGQLEAIISLDNAPTVDIKDQIAGAYNEGYMCGSREAEKARPQGFWAEFEGGYRCSNCDDIEVYTPNFCPNCGAKMKGGTENGKD